MAKSLIRDATHPHHAPALWKTLPVHQHLHHPLQAMRSLDNCWSVPVHCTALHCPLHCTALHRIVNPAPFQHHIHVILLCLSTLCYMSCLLLRCCLFYSFHAPTPHFPNIHDNIKLETWDLKLEPFALGQHERKLTIENSTITHVLNFRGPLKGMAPKVMTKN